MHYAFFPGQRENEKVVLFIRKHWISFIPVLLLITMMIILPIFAYFAITKTLSIELSPFVLKEVILGYSGYVLLVITFYLVGWIDYYFDVLIVTNERLVNIEQNGLFNRHISELDLLRIQNVSSNIKGIVPTIFNYGSMIVQTAGEHSLEETHIESSDFTMEAAPNPQKIAQIIMETHKACVHQRDQSHAATHGEGEIHPHEDSPTETNKHVAAPPHYSDDEVAVLKEVVDEGQLKEGEIIDL